MEFLRLLGRMETTGKNELILSGESRDPWTKRAVANYGVSIKVGVPIIPEGSSGRRPPLSAIAGKHSKPLIDLMDEREHLRVLVEAPGVTAKDTVYADVRAGRLTVSAYTETKEYHHDVMLPCRIEPGSIKATCKNGTIEIVLQKIQSARAGSEDG